MFADIEFGLFAKVGFDSLLSERQIIGMYVISPCADIIRQFVLGVSKHALPTRREKTLICLDIPIPQTVVAAVYGKLPPLFADAQRLFNFFKLGDMLLQADKFIL